MQKAKVLITGASGQIGQVLYKALANHHGYDEVIATDLIPCDVFDHFEELNILDEQRMRSIIQQYEIREIYHLAAILSAVGEKKPKRAWDININGLLNVLDLSLENRVKKVFFPSSIAVFGPNIPLVNTPQHVPLYPSTVYGISKAAGENLSSYYYNKFDLDVRSIRYPGVIGYQTLPGGGTTDYAVEIFHEALKQKRYTCFLEAGATLPMMYMDDVIRATLELMHAPAAGLSTRAGYNIAGASFSPAEIAEEIKKHIPDFKMEYNPDYRQLIAESWPQSIDDSLARKDWGWKPDFDLQKMTIEMLDHLRPTYSEIPH